ncbi:PD40 domain-containing protein [Carboxylicivirga sp. M1479]|uniref:PD40 domain-containing protein n=2 Tax=Carboxylicivirga TaxID=1628153 RepID=UPI00163DCB25|nr:PD40 domain-containing protein [Carboxylicivirga sp. M1479]
MKIFLIIIFIGFSLFAGAQSKELQKADDLFNKFNYSKAISSYQKILNKGKHTYYCSTKIAECYTKQNNSEEAILWYKKCIEHPEFDSKLYLSLAQELLKEGKQQEASVFFHKYYQHNQSPHQLLTLSYIEYYNELYRDSNRYKAIPLTINTQYDEFGPALYQNEMVFTSNRPLKSISKRNDVQTGQAFFNLFTVDKTSSEAKLFSKDLQTKYNDGPVSFSTDLKTIYITRNTNFETKGINTLDVFVTKASGEGWSKDIKRLPIRKGNYTVAHATISNNGQYLFFSSDMPGGYGGMDLYACEIKNGFIGQATNLGKHVNTAGNEIFPFVDSKDVLYFSSNMHPGIGGYDLFFSKKINGQYSIPFNMGYPANSKADDFSLVLDTNSKFGFFASNRGGGQGGDDLYALQIIQAVDYCMVEATVYSHADSTLLANAFVNIINVETGISTSTKTNSSGKFICHLKKDKKYTFEVRRKLYTDFKGVLTPEELQKFDVLKLNIGLQEK